VPVATGLPDGRVLVVGRDPEAGRAEARLIDPGGTRTSGEAELEPLDPSRVATHLVRLADGVVAEADADGVSLLRLDLATPFADPSARIFPGQPNQRHEVSLDAPGSWDAEAGLLVARRDGARLDLPTSRFADARVELEVEGAVELLLTPAGSPPLAVAIDSRGVSVGDCGMDRPDGLVRVRRSGDRITLGAGGSTVECAVDLEGRVGVAVRASTGAGIRQLAVARE
jgi:hypothetical protein